MDRLTFKEPDGTWGIVGMTQDNTDQKMYAVAAKLLAYEETGFSPDELKGLCAKASEGERDE